MLNDEGLAAGLVWLAQWMRAKHGLAVELECEDAAQDLSEDIRVLVFQSTRELLFNVVKHAGASRAWVSLERCDGMLRVRVRDEGAGFDAKRMWDRAALTKGGFGLRTVRDRLAMAGGRLEVDSEPGDGAMFTLLVPASHNDSVESPETQRRE